MTDLNQKLLSKQANMMTFDQLTQKVQAQLSSVTSKNQQLMKKADSDYDPQFLKNFQNYKKQIQDEIQETQETIKILLNKAKTHPQKQTVKKFTEQSSQQLERFKTSVKKIVNSSFANKQDFLRKSSVLNNSRSIDSDGNINDESGRNDASQRQLQQQQQQYQQQYDQEQKQYNHYLDMEKQLAEEQQNELNRFEKDIYEVNQNFNKIGEMIVEQGNNIDAIEETTFETKNQVAGAKREITEANKTHQSTKRKYIIFALLILVALGVTLAIVFTQM